jgi:hypothetical protein
MRDIEVMWDTKEALGRLKDSLDEASRLARWLIGLTGALLILTGALVVLTATLAPWVAHLLTQLLHR